MPFSLPTDPERDEIFVKNYVRSRDAVDACTKARIFVPGYDIRDVAVYQLAKPEIQRAISKAEATKATEAPAEISKDSIVNDLQDVYERSSLAGEFQSAITAKKTQAQLLGYLEQNITLTVKNDVSSLTDAEIEKRLLALQKQSKVIDGEFKDVTPAQRGGGAPALSLSAYGAPTVAGNAKA